MAIHLTAASSQTYYAGSAPSLTSINANWAMFAMVNADGFTGSDRTVFSMDNSAADEYHQILFRTNGAGRFRSKNSGGSPVAATTAGTASTGVWSSISGYMNSSGHRSISINAGTVATDTASGNPSAVDETRIGSLFRSGTGTVSFFDGNVGYLGLWDTTGSSWGINDIIRLHGGIHPLTYRQGELVGFWPCFPTETTGLRNFWGAGAPDLTLGTDGTAGVGNPSVKPWLFGPSANARRTIVTGGGRIMSSLAGTGGLAGMGGIAGAGGGLAG